ncbi:MAG TPA: hypothetical protein IAA07_09095 [Candidatus Lachnoclostridium stercoravium]|uniref:Uncharacterized protein n=1 Tax=Candidatus Lachnoclostridium stercoravium TaxID=2838633 RepID=A0A9D2HHK4_9FIRM|nr:hypothetical protein [Candidatus Lachnoclostridium stercoravium]
MSSRLIIDGNAVYEIDEDCMRENERQRIENTGNDSSFRQGRRAEGRTKEKY